MREAGEIRTVSEKEEKVNLCVFFWHWPCLQRLELIRNCAGRVGEAQGQCSTRFMGVYCLLFFV